MNRKSIIKYSLLFILFFSSMIFFYIPFRMDTYVNYGFSYGIANGQIPYRDFNIIVPLFGPFLYSIGLIINKSIIVYYIEQAILLVAFCYFLFKLMKEKAWIVIVSLFCPFIFCFAYCIFPGYNFIILFELLLLLYLNENNKSDYLIGILCGLSIITKQNVGIPIFLVTLIYPIIKDKNLKKTFKRLISGLIPLIVFLMYLLMFNNLKYFIDLCFLGMSDFKHNFQINYFFMALTCLSIIIIIIQFIKKKKINSSYFYLISYLPVIYPLIEEYHVSLFLFFAFIVFIYNSDIHTIKHIVQISYIIIIAFIASYCFAGKKYFDIVKIYNYHNFPVEYLSQSMKEDSDEIIKLTKKNNVIFVGDPSKTIFFTSASRKKLNNYYIMFRGNQGSKGIKGLLKNIENEKDVYYVVSDYINCHDKSCQFDTNISKTISKKYKLVSKLNHFSIYYKK